MTGFNRFFVIGDGWLGCDKSLVREEGGPLARSGSVGPRRRDIGSRCRKSRRAPTLFLEMHIEPCLNLRCRMDGELCFLDGNDPHSNQLRCAPTLINRCAQAQTGRSCLVSPRNGPHGSGEPFHPVAKDPGAYSRPFLAANYSSELTLQPAVLVSDSVKVKASSDSGYLVAATLGSEAMTLRLQVLTIGRRRPGLAAAHGSWGELAL